MSDIKQINAYFGRFMEEVELISNNVTLESEYTKGYLACMSDILNELSSESEDDQSDLAKMMKKKIEMSSRQEVIGEVMEGLQNLYSAYSKISKEG